jgi:hypothetical protein
MCCENLKGIVTLFRQVALLLLLPLLYLPIGRKAPYTSLLFKSIFKSFNTIDRFDIESANLSSLMSNLSSLYMYECRICLACKSTA